MSGSGYDAVRYVASVCEVLTSLRMCEVCGET